MHLRAFPLVVSGSTLLTALAAALLATSCGDSNETPETVPTGSTSGTTSTTAPSSTATSTAPASTSSPVTSSATSTSPTGGATSTSSPSTTTGASGASSSTTTTNFTSSGGSGTSTAATSDTATNAETSSAPPGAVEWAQSGSTWSATIGATTFSVDEAGGRIVGYALGNTELLVDESDVSGDNANNYGSTFWLSPQAEWNEGGWPPPTHIDSEDYEAAAAGETLTLTGPGGTASDSEATNDLSIVKVFTPDAARNAITVDYQIENAGGSASIEWAPWQITRVPGGGITFFPSGEAVAGLKAELPMTKLGAYSFWQYDEGDISDADGADHGDKFIGDGAGGWLAHLHEGVLLLLQFTDTAPGDFATDDGEIAIYASAADPYIEIEPQGGVVSIPPNGSSSWKVRWSLHTLPTEVVAEPGEALGAFAQGIATELGAP